jgi:hypothetical protein
MSKENIFDLSKLVSTTNDVEISHTEGIRENALKNYEPVPQEEWVNIPYNSHIRYLNKDGSFRMGGFVQRISKSIDKKNDEVVKIELTSSYGGKTTQWAIVSTKVAKIWKKISFDVEVERPKADLEMLKEDIAFCKESIRHISTELQKMKNEQIRIVELIKKLHKL